LSDLPDWVSPRENSPSGVRLQKSTIPDSDPVVAHVVMIQPPCQNPWTLGVLGEVGEPQADVVPKRRANMSARRGTTLVNNNRILVFIGGWVHGADLLADSSEFDRSCRVKPACSVAIL